MTKILRTDDKAFNVYIEFGGRKKLIESDLVEAEVARELERKLNAAVEALELCSAVIGAPEDGEWKSFDDCNAAFNAAQAVITKAKGEQL